MQEFFFTILVIWILFKILGGVSVRTFTFNNTNHYPKQEPSKKEGEVKIDTTNTPPKTPLKKPTFNKDAGEYVDYEEIK